LLLLVKNGKGALGQIAQAVAMAQADISHIEMDNQLQAEAVELRLLVTVRDRQHLADLLRTLKRASPVLRAARVKP
jgi:GTP pyrophosphokinase/guanosine-3',5'-bis(diphosphate) 3'-pyrophosphohydrolase